MKINFKTLGIKAAALVGGVAAIWLAVKPAEKEETPDLLADLPELDDAPAPEPAAEETEAEETESEETPEEEETEQA